MVEKERDHAFEQLRREREREYLRHKNYAATSEEPPSGKLLTFFSLFISLILSLHEQNAIVEKVSKFPPLLCIVQLAHPSS
jgi:hypothetical protein